MSMNNRNKNYTTNTLQMKQLINKSTRLALAKTIIMATLIYKRLRSYNKLTQHSVYKN